MSMTLVSTILFSVTLMNVEADSLPYYDPPSPWVPSYSYAFMGASSILREQREQLLLMNAEAPAYRTTHVIALVNKDYRSIREDLRGLALARWGILEEHDNETSQIPEPPPHIVRDDLDWPILGQGLLHLTDQSSHLKVQEYQLTSQPYNRVASINGYSQVVIRASDGTGLLGSEVTILQLTRSDRSREWARSGFHALFPLPYKEERTSMGVVTSTEIALIEGLKERFPGIAIRYFVTYGLHTDSEYGRLLRTQMEEASHQFKK